MITGFLEAGEDPAEAILRETREELGLVATHSRFIGHYIYAAANQLILAYLVTAHGEFRPSEEISEVRLLRTTELAHYDFGPLYIAAQAAKECARHLASA